MDYIYLQLLIFVGFLLCIINAMGCLQYLSKASLIYLSQSPFVRYMFGVSGMLLLLASVYVLFKIESSF